MIATDPSSDIGIAISTLSVAENDPRKIQQTSPVNTSARPSSRMISSIESEMNCVVSKMTSMCIDAGSVFCRSTSATRTAFATETAFDPRCFKMPIACTGSPFERAYDVMS